EDGIRGDLVTGVQTCALPISAVGATLELDLALGEAPRTDQHLPGDADQVHGCELGTGPLVEVMVEHVEAARGQLAVELFARRVRSEEHTSELQSPDHLVCRLL